MFNNANHVQAKPVERWVPFKFTFGRDAPLVSEICSKAEFQLGAGKHKPVLLIEPL